MAILSHLLGVYLSPESRDVLGPMVLVFVAVAFLLLVVIPWLGKHR